MDTAESIVLTPKKARRKWTIDDIHTLAHERGGECLSHIYINSATKLSFRCANGHTWETAPSNFCKGTWCPVCNIAQKKQGTFKEACALRGIVGADYWRALKRRDAGMSEEAIFEESCIRSQRVTSPIVVYGVAYPNLEEAMRRLHPAASCRTLSRWLRSGLTAEEAFERIPNPGYANGIIYLVTHIVSGKQYVGLTIQTVERRWMYHQEQARAGHIKGENSLHAALRQYGADAFTIRHIDSGTTKKGLEERERFWIASLRTLAPHGYNLHSGGVSGGSNSQPIVLDHIRFPSKRKAIEHIAVTRHISLHAAKKRLEKQRIDL